MKYNLFAAILIFFATVKVFAALLDLDKLAALASTTNLAPAMKVFTAHDGYETYSSTFHIQALYKDGQSVSRTLTPKMYASLKGPYNRRNVYGALIAYGPILYTNPHTSAMYKAMTQKSFCVEPNILLELTFNNQSGLSEIVIDYTQPKASKNYPDQIKVRCE